MSMQHAVHWFSRLEQYAHVLKGVSLYLSFFEFFIDFVHESYDIIDSLVFWVLNDADIHF